MPIPFPAFYHHKQSKTSDRKANNKILFTFENVLSFILKQKTKKILHTNGLKKKS